MPEESYLDSLKRQRDEARAASDAADKAEKEAAEKAEKEAADAAASASADDDDKTEDASKADKPEDQQKPEGEQPESEDTQKTGKTDDKSDAAKESSSSKADDDANKDQGDQKTVPRKRFAQVARDRRKLNKENLNLQDELADKDKELKRLHRRARLQGISLEDGEDDLNDEQLAELADATNLQTAEAIAELQEQRREQASSAASQEDPLASALRENETTNEWLEASDIGDDEDWQAFRSVWNEFGDDYLTDNFASHSERIEHVVKETEKRQKAAAAKKIVDKQVDEQPDNAARRSLNNASGSESSTGSELDQLLKRSDQTEYMMKLSQSSNSADRAKFDKLRSALRQRTMEQQKIRKGR